MKKRVPPKTAEAIPESKLHPRNRDRGRYDFPRLMEVDVELRDFVAVNALGDLSLDFANQAAVKALNRALLKASYGIQAWDIPPRNLCPSVPGRADYLHYLADVLASKNGGVIPATNVVQVLDIGTGSNCIYPLIGASEFGWRFVATDINSTSLKNAQAILAANPALGQQITLRLQPSSTAILKGMVLDDEWFDLTMCNPPFHASLTEAKAGTQRKWKNLSKQGGEQTTNLGLNFGGQDAELWCPGGEQSFIQQMIKESAQIPTRCFWFSTLVSKSASLPGIYVALKRTKVLEYKTIAMRQGQKQSRLITWTFLNPAQQAAWRKTRW
jgi:23S rRNA (adenine1618-N6)-methyltransferase